jgi:hypothetical protein
MSNADPPFGGNTCWTPLASIEIEHDGGEAGVAVRLPLSVQVGTSPEYATANASMCVPLSKSVGGWLPLMAPLTSFDGPAGIDTACGPGFVYPKTARFGVRPVTTHVSCALT